MSIDPKKYHTRYNKSKIYLQWYSMAVILLASCIALAAFLEVIIDGY